MTENTPKMPWTQWEPGDKVVVRYQEEGGMRDALGKLLETSPHHVVIDTKRGEVKVLATQMVTGKLVAKGNSLG